MFTIHVIHASHTDVGYTDTQEKMKAHHVAFIREAVQLVQTDGEFRWNCESYWCVEQFLKEASPEETALFIQAVREGRICLSGSYLNLTDLVPEDVYRHILDDCECEWNRLGIHPKSALTADINGYSWGVPDLLLDHGVKRLMSNIHTHHGYHPLFRKQTPFWWEAPSGRKLLVWNGEHYNLGNELGIAQTSWFEYTVHDGISNANLSEYEKACMRIEAYVRSVQEQEYPYDFIPVGVSSGMTDNAPPSLAIPEFIRKYNSEHSNIQLCMSTLDKFFDKLEQESSPIPTYRGDWTDWWADGVGSTPADIIQYRQAARNFSIVSQMDPACSMIPESIYRETYKNLMFYGEHTWGYSSSITEPFHPQVNNLDQWKRLYALKACEDSVILREQIQRIHGETAVSMNGELKYRAVNPHSRKIETMLQIDLEHFYGHQYFQVLDEATGQPVPFQISRYARGPQMCIWLTLNPKETKTFILQEIPKAPLPSAGLKAETGIEGVDDLYWKVSQQLNEQDCITESMADNRFFHLQFAREKGIISIFDKTHQQELVNEAFPFTAFMPIYEITHRREEEDYLYVRRNMGRNRNAFRTIRSGGRLKDTQIKEKGPLYDRIELQYDLPGTQQCSLILTIYKLSPRIGVDVRVHKESVWEPENLYLSLPFQADEIWIDKTAALLRPRRDQLPGTCIDYYCLQNGVVFMRKDSSLIISCRDVPLIHMGPLPAHSIQLMGENDRNVDEVYSWVMNNFWETNFHASLGGFYQFHYDLFLSEETPQEALQHAKDINEDVLTFYLFDHEAKE